MCHGISRFWHIINNPISSRGSDYAPTSLLAPSNFQTFLRPTALVHQMVSLTSNFKPMNINYDFFFYCSNWKELWKKLVKTSNEFVIGPVWARSLQIVFKEMEQISNYFEIFFFISIFQLGYHTLGSANTPVAIWRDTRKWFESFMGNSQWETASTYTWLSRSFRIFNESMLEQRCKRQANHGWDFDIN